MVAERPHVRRAGWWNRSRASASSTCTPRFVPMSSCHSSTTTSRRSPKISRASARARRSESDSGVVMSAVGSRRRWRARSAADVSPVRDSSVHGMPRSTSGSRSACSVSAASARRGVTQRTRSAGDRSRRVTFGCRVRLRRRAPGWLLGEPLVQCAAPGCERLAGSRCRVNESALAGAICGPHLTLECEWFPAVCREPLVETLVVHVVAPRRSRRTEPDACHLTRRRRAAECFGFNGSTPTRRRRGISSQGSVRIRCIRPPLRLTMPPPRSESLKRRSDRSTTLTP